MTKKLVALVMALMMLLSVTALAETTDTSDWETYSFEDAQLTISCPADMAVVELTDEQTEAGICFATAAADGSLSMALYCFDPEGATLADAQSEMEAEEGYQCAANQVNGIDVVAFTTVANETTVLGCLVMGADGYVYQFMFMPTNDAGTQMADQIISTLNVLEAE